MSLWLDIQGAQSPHDLRRGIGRYVREFAAALLELPSRHLAACVLNPALAVPGNLDRLHMLGPVTFNDRITPRTGDIYHIGYPLECKVHLDSIWPAVIRANRLQVSATLFDLIPLLLPQDYLADAMIKTRYFMRLEALRQADRVLAISESAATDAVSHLALEPEKIAVIGAGVSSHFVLPASRQTAKAEAQRRLPGLSDSFVLFLSALDLRKNVVRAVKAFQLLPSEIRSTYQVVVAGELSDLDARQLRHASTGSQSILTTGFVSEEILTLLYQACDLFVFPSLYEGFGLPVAEAQACGAPVLTSNTSSLRELVTSAEARFEPTNITSIRDTLGSALAHPDRLAAIRSTQEHVDWSWKAVAERAESVFDDLGRRPRPRRVRARIAVVSPLPPQRSGVADYTSRLLIALSTRIAVDAFSDAQSAHIEPIPGVSAMNIRVFEEAERLLGPYAQVVYCLGNSPYHTSILELLLRRRGVVIAHDLRFTDLYSAQAAVDTHPSKCFAETIRRMYGSAVYPALPHTADYEDFATAGLFMAREIISASELFFVHSEYAARIARLEAPSSLETRIATLPFACPLPSTTERNFDGPPIVCTFGHVHPIKHHEKIVEALPAVLERVPDTRLVIVGPVWPAFRRQLHRRARDLHISDRVVILGGVSNQEYHEWLERATVAVQLRAAWNGENSASVCDCLASGTPTIVTALGSASDIPLAVVEKVERYISPERLGVAISDLLCDRARRSQLCRRGKDYAARHTFEHLAETLLKKLNLTASAIMVA